MTDIQTKDSDLRDKSCECEHNKHFEESEDVHPYGEKFLLTQITYTEYGTFQVCTLCFHTCYKQTRGRRTP